MMASAALMGAICSPSAFVARRDQVNLISSQNFLDKMKRKKGERCSTSSDVDAD
jgi:hypothetical protein